MTGKKILRKAALLTTVAAGLVGGAYYAVGWWQHGRFDVSTDDAYLQADSTIIAPKVSGYVAKVLVTDNQHVAAGEVLARIDPRDLQDAFAEAKAEVAVGRQGIANLVAQIALQHSVVAQAAAEETAARAALTYALENSGRYAVLARSGAGTIQSEQRAAAALIEAKAALRHDRAMTLAATQKIAVLETARAQAAALLDHAQAAARQAALNLSYTTITAPIAGTVGNRSLRVGQYVRAGTQLMALVPLRHVYVTANFKETQLTRARPGQTVDVAVDMFPDTVLHGRVVSLAPATGLEFALLPPDNATGNFTKIVQRIPVKIELDAGTRLLGRLRPGMSVEATIDTESRPATAAARMATSFPPATRPAVSTQGRGR